MTNEKYISIDYLAIFRDHTNKYGMCDDYELYNHYSLSIKNAIFCSA